MSPRLPRITAHELLRALHRAGWYDSKQEGSHLTLRHPDRPSRLVVPVHVGAILKPGLLKGILDDAGMTAEELRNLL